MDSKRGITTLSLPSEDADKTAIRYQKTAIKFHKRKNILIP